jgi:Flp pilus assembly protein TadG
MNKMNREVCKGTVMVELAIILPLLLLLLFGVTELGRALYQQNILTQAVELGGRYLARIDGAVVDDGSGGCTTSNE